MREIKFRAWHKKAQKMSENTVTIQEAYDNEGFTNAEECEWLQYTGLKDVNGVEICEGDIVHVGAWGEPWSVEYDEQEACFIVYNQLNSTRRFDTDFTDPECPIVSICEGMEFKPEVIGNIYENKELIK
jgi:uncharacterized phage protein (TIGR01671 family)